MLIIFLYLFLYLFQVSDEFVGEFDLGWIKTVSWFILWNVTVGMGMLLMKKKIIIIIWRKKVGHRIWHNWIFNENGNDCRSFVRPKWEKKRITSWRWCIRGNGKKGNGNLSLSYSSSSNFFFFFFDHWRMNEHYSYWDWVIL